MADEPAVDPAPARATLKHGVLGGLLGGLVFSAIMVINGTLTDMGMLTLPLIGELVGHPSAWIGFAVHMLNSALIGALYVLIFGRVEKGMVDGIHLGMLYGAAWWFIGPLTLMPKLLGLEVGSQWTFESMLRLFPSLIGHLVFGTLLGMTVGAARDRSLDLTREELRERELIDSGMRPADVQSMLTGTPPEEVEEKPERVELAWGTRARWAEGRVPLPVTMALITLIFLMNLLIFGYGAAQRFPTASHGADHAPAPSEEADTAHHEAG